MLITNYYMNLKALELLEKYPNSNFVVDARNGFEDEKEDVKRQHSCPLKLFSVL